MVTLAVTPTSASMAATASVSCRSFRWMPLPLWSSISTPFAKPASARSFFAIAGSYG